MAIFYPTDSAGVGVGSDDCTAVKDKVLAGYTAVTADSDDEAVEGTLEVQSIVNFNVAQYSSLTLLASWALPAKGPWSGLRIMCKQGDYPSSPQDGILFYEGGAASASKALAAGTWYFRAWDYISTNYGRIYGGYHDKSAGNVQIKGQQIYTSSGTFTVPANVKQIQVFVVGGGGGGTYNSESYGGGGGGGYTNYNTFQVSPGGRYTITIGAGGAQPGYRVGSPGGTTSFGGSVSAAGGNAGSGITGGNGGSGGGGANGAGGSNGGNGGNYPGYGQGRTTRAFGEANNTLYAGGGGGGSYSDQIGFPGGGGGAWGSNPGWSTVPADPGTGGGGGGGCDDRSRSASAGGSGICIIRWGY